MDLQGPVDDDLADVDSTWKGRFLALYVRLDLTAGFSSMSFKLGSVFSVLLQRCLLLQMQTHWRVDLVHSAVWHCTDALIADTSSFITEFIGIRSSVATVSLDLLSSSTVYAAVVGQSESARNVFPRGGDGRNIGPQNC
jgi:hypothetical protein